MARTKSHPLDYWRNYFKTATNSNVFDIIDRAIMVAATDFPAEFNLQRDRIVQRLSLAQCFGVNGDSNDDDEASDSLGEVLNINEVLQSSGKDEADEDIVFQSLKRLESMDMSFETLQETGIGNFVSDLKKHGSTRIRDLAQTLVAGWKLMVDDYMRNQNDHKDPDHKQEPPTSNMVDKEKKNHKIVRINIKKPEETDMVDKEKKNHKIVRIKFKKPEETVAVKLDQSSSESSVVVTSGGGSPPNNASMEQRKTVKVLDKAAYEAKLEATKRKLHDCYQEVENAKRQRTAIVLNRVPEPTKAADRSLCPKTNKLLKLRKQGRLVRM